MKKTKGFTLVELVVVIAIIGVLAAILVPTMLTYIRKAKLKSANTNAKTAYNAVVEFFTEKNANDGSSLSAIMTMYGNQVIDCNVPPDSTMTAAQMRVHNILATNGISSGHVWVDMTQINNTDAIFCQWTIDQNADQIADAVVGQFPDPISWETYKATSFCWKSYVAPI